VFTEDTPGSKNWDCVVLNPDRVEGLTTPRVEGNIFTGVMLLCNDNYCSYGDMVTLDSDTPVGNTIQQTPLIKGHFKGQYENETFGVLRIVHF